MNLEKRLAYLATLSPVDPPAFFSAVEPWLYGECPLPRVATIAPVSQTGAILLPFSDMTSVIWGWTLQRLMRGKSALLIPCEKNGTRGLVVASTDGAIWVQRFFDPSEHAFWTWGRRKIPDLRMYAFILPPTRSLTVCNIECLFSGKWKPGKIVSVQTSRGEIMTVSGYLMKRDALLRHVKVGMETKKIIVGAQLPRPALLATVTGTVPDLATHKVRRYGSCVHFCKTRLFLTEDDELAIGLLENNGRVTLEVENGIPVAVSSENGISIPLVVVRGSDGQPIAAYRSKVEKLHLPRVASIHRLKVTLCQGDRFIRAAGKRFVVPHGFDLFAGTSLIVVLETGTRILYVSRHEKLTNAERALVKLLEIFSMTDPTSPDRYSALQNIVNVSAANNEKNALDPTGVRWLYETLMKNLATTPESTHTQKNARGIRLRLMHHLRRFSTPPRPPI